MLEVRIYENNECIWMRRKEDMAGMTNRNHVTDGTYSRIKAVLVDALEQVDGNFGLAQKDIKKQIAESIDDSKHPVLMALLSKANISQFQLYEPYGIKGKRLHIKFFSPEGTIEYISERK